MLKFRCIQSFAAEGPGELSIGSGELVISKTDDPQDGWLSVKSLQSKMEGYVPRAYLELLSDQSAVAGGGAGAGAGAEYAAKGPAYPVMAASPTSPQMEGGFQQQQFYDPQQAMSNDLQQPSVDFSASPTNPFDSMSSSIGGALPATTATSTSGAAASDPKSKRHSYAPGVGTNSSHSQKDQYKVTNPTQFQETLELWRERERRFMKGEPERLPQPKKREYFYWDRNGNRVGPLTEDQMRAKFDNRELAPDTFVSLNVDKAAPTEAQQLQQLFPEIANAFNTVPVVANKTNEVLWLYKDDLGMVQGPFSSQQMRDWFNDGFFNEFTMVALNESPDEFVQLGLLFPEGEGCFLSKGDQEGAKAQQAAIDAIGRAPAPSIAFDGAPNPFDSNPYGSGGGDMFMQGQGNPYYGAGDEYGAGPPAWGGPEQVYVPPPQPVDYGAVSGMDPYGSNNGSGRGLFLEALSGPPPALGSAPPAALGAQGGAPPPALQQQKSDDWGITWDDEEEWTQSNDANKSDEPTNEDEAIPLSVAHHDESDEEAPKVIRFQELQEKYLSTVDALYVFLTRSLPKNLGTVRCKIKRSVVGMHVNYNLYELYLEREDSSLGPQILIAQKHRRMGFDSYYNIGIGSVNKKESGKVISSLIFNTAGTNFVCHNNVAAHKGKPRDLACVVYQRNIGKGPRKFQVALPALRDGSEIEQVEWAHGGSVKRSKMLQSLVSLDFGRLQPLVNKKPTWSKKHRAWVLNFHGRVTRSSVKNFQLVRPDDNKNVVLQFGRVGTDTFTMDMQWPISPVAAFAICVSSLHSKLLVE